MKNHKIGRAINIFVLLSFTCVILILGMIVCLEKINENSFLFDISAATLLFTIIVYLVRLLKRELLLLQNQNNKDNY